MKPNLKSWIKKEKGHLVYKFETAIEGYTIDEVVD